MTGRRYRLWPAIFAVLVLPLLWAPAAHAVSKIKVREVYAGTNDDSYVEIQGYAPSIYAGFEISGKSLILFDSDGNPYIRFTFVRNNFYASENTMFLVADTGVEQNFGIARDTDWHSEVVDPEMEIDPAGGAACWNVGDTPVDCVSWGDFSGEAKLQAYSGTSSGNPADPGGIPAGKALKRTIKPNCPTWLEEEDDTGDSATDFSDAEPDPHNPGSFPASEPEGPCESGMPEHTAIGQKPSFAANSADANFTYSATGATSYQCKLDSAPRYTTCPSGGQDYAGLADGTHVFQVRGLNSSGFDKAPASHLWTVDTRPPLSTFLSHPAAQSFGRSATFAFSSDEPSPTFRCALDNAAPTPCQSGIALSSLTTGTHTFHVAAVDAAGNVQASPTSFTWFVNADTPQTTIDARPDDPSASTAAHFTYHANRPDTVFECSLDDGAFSSCPSSGATYVSLAKGRHTFSVRAIDSDGVVEGSFPSYSFTIAAPAAPRSCKKGQRKKVVRGEVKCVKKKHRRSPRAKRFRS